MNRKKKYVVSVIALLLIGFNGFSQSTSDPIVNNFKGKLEKHFVKSITEKVYLHTDKDVYQLGDTLWFKAYFTKYNHVGSLSSNILSLALYNDKNEEIEKEHFKVLYGRSDGCFIVPDYLDDGDYKLIAYSDYMQNVDSTNLFSKTIRIFENRPAFQIVIKEQSEYHNVGDSVNIQLLVLTKDDQALEKIPVEVAIVKGKRTYDKLELESDKNGRINLKLKIPEKDIKDQLYIEARSNYLNYNVSSTKKLPIKGENYQLRFFPEGGELISDVTNRIAFEVYDDYNNLVNVKGLLKDSIGTIIDSVSTSYIGIGSFSYKPISGNKYFIEIQEPYKSKERIKLPEAKSTGISLRVDHQKEGTVSVDINASEDLRNEEIYGVLYSGDKVYWSRKINLKNESQVIIPINNLNEGLSQFTVFTANNKPIAERLVFIPSKKKLKIKVRAGKETYKPKEKVDLNIEVTDIDGNPVSSNLSISVVDESAVLPNNHNHIVTYNLFDGELSENLNDQLLLDNHFINEEYANLILMTKGWRRFNWKEIQESETNEGINTKNKKFISGRVNNHKGKPVKNANIQLFNSQLFKVVNTSSDENGEFFFNAKEYISVVDTGLLVITASRKGGESNVNIVLDDSYTTLIDRYIETIKAPKDFLSLSNYETIANSKNNQDYYKNFNAQTVLIEEVSVKGIRRVKIEEAAYERLYHSTVLEGKDVGHVGGGVGSFIDVLSKMTTFTVTEDYQILLRGANSFVQLGGALIVVDGMALGDDIRVLDNMNLNEIKSVTVIKNPAAAYKYSGGKVGGLIEIKLKGLGDFKASELKNKYKNKLYYRGCIASREFYSPIYNTEEEKLYSYDIRNTLYWNPNLDTDDSGEHKVSFVTSDEHMRIKIIVEGMNFDRMAGHGEAEFVVY